MHALLIEDNPDFAESLIPLLAQRGCEITWETGADAGLEAARRRTYQIVFCDIGLPGGMNGLQFAQSVRKERRLAESLLVSLSGHADTRSREEAIRAGFDYVLTKPLDFGDLDEVLEKAARRLHFE